MVPAAVSIDFRTPMLVGVEYGVRVKTEGDTRVTAVVTDGSALVLRIRLQFRNGKPRVEDLPPVGTAPIDVARQNPHEALLQGLEFEGSYSPASDAYSALMARLEIDRDRVGDALPLALLCSSYATGMELPGESATYILLHAELSDASIEVPFRFAVQLRDFDNRYSVARTVLQLGEWATANISALARPPRRIPAVLAGGTKVEGFAGKHVLVVGASRGLGAALGLQLAAAGAQVTGIYARSREDAARLEETARGLDGSLCMEQGDAGDANWCGQFARSLVKPIDVLICNAAPPLHPLRIEENSAGRIQKYVETGFALVASPLSVFLPALAARSGAVLLVSSSAVEEPPRAWPHYVALKRAAEGLVEAATREYAGVSFVIARPSKMLTDLIDTPLGRAGAEDPAITAHRLLEALAAARPGAVSLCR